MTSRHPAGNPGPGGPLIEYGMSFEDEVLDAVPLIPPGRVVTYGDVAEYLGRGGPRQVAKVMARAGAAVPWWRVVRSDGSLPERLMPRAAGEYLAESTPVVRDAEGGVSRVDIRRARWHPEET